jgi:hypothetical protein
MAVSPVKPLTEYKDADRASEEVMNWYIRLAAPLVMLALAGCTQGITGQGQASYAPYSHTDKGTIHDGGDGGSGGM